MTVQINGETIKSAVSYKIRNSFAEGTTYPQIYKEQTVQNMIKPCFFIWAMDVEQIRGLGNRYQQVYQMNIRYHIPEGQADAYEQLCNVGIKLMDYLRYIQVPFDGESPQLVRGRDLNFQITDGVLQMYVIYTLEVKDAEVKIPMGELEQNIN